MAGVLALFWVNNYFFATRSTDNQIQEGLAQRSLVASIIGFTLGSVGEEIVYRGFLQTYINVFVGAGKRAIGRGNLFASLCMTLTHFGFFMVMDPLFAVTGVLLVALFSLVAGYLRDRTRSLLLPVLLHLLCNYIHIAVQLCFA